MSSQMPPIPPASRSNKGVPKKGVAPETAKEEKLVKHEHHPNAGEEGHTANIRQNTTNKGYFHGRRVK